MNLFINFLAFLVVSYSNKFYKTNVPYSHYGYAMQLFVKTLFNYYSCNYTHKCLSIGLSLPGGLPPEDQCLVFQKFFSQPIENDIKHFFHQLQKDQIS